MKKRLIYFTKHENLGASSRYRSVQYFTRLREDGYDIKHYPLFSDEYLICKYKLKKQPVILSILSLVKRILILLFYIFNRRGIVVVEKEFIPYFLPLFEWLYFISSRKFILDYDDAVWQNYKMSKSLIVKFLLKNKHEKLIKYSNGVICGSEYIYNFAKKNGALRLIKIPTVIDIDKYTAFDHGFYSKDKFIIGWIGSPSSSQYLKEIEPALTRFTSEFNSVVHLIGVDDSTAANFSFENIVIPWSSDTEVDSMSVFDVGIMPLSSGPFEEGKCAFKLIQYMALNKPVICSPVGENTIVVNEHCGFLAISNEDWFSSLKILYSDSLMCKNFGIKSREIVENNYTLQFQYPNYINFLENYNG